MGDTDSSGYISVKGNRPVSSRTFASETDVEIHPNVIRDEYKNLREVSEAIGTQGIESCHMIFGIDYSISNNRTGEKTFGGKSLHSIEESGLNPYQKVICVFGETLEPFNQGENIPVFGFGDFKCKDKSIFELKPGEKLQTASDVLAAYKEVTPMVKLAGPTQLAPLIYRAIDVVKETKKYHILIIATDGQIPDKEPTAKAVIEASDYPLSIIVVGVGDRPWDTMKQFDDELPNRKFDNFQFVNFHEVMNNRADPEAAFALHALMEIPKQYQYLKEQDLIH
ncbi:uncharacterized protein LOC132753225 [Ruditapes philippinarum]|uniref:uncharacterized protein LOC132753225 n=1 Tax=Ruditapes philippinarum TaxID=129788 RepID=UPI00295BE608|nr:uncharacterized protein LOC132753225 [Ruditapes philippinarum]